MSEVHDAKRVAPAPCAVSRRPGERGVLVTALSLKVGTTWKPKGSGSIPGIARVRALPNKSTGGPPCRSRGLEGVPPRVPGRTHAASTSGPADASDMGCNSSSSPGGSAASARAGGTKASTPSSPAKGGCGPSSGGAAHSPANGPEGAGHSSKL